MQAAAGITLQVFSTGRGTPYGLAAVLVLKVSSNSALKDKWPDLIDFDAGRVVSGGMTIPRRSRVPAGKGFMVLEKLVLCY
jgi:galactarate dehydratase